MNPSDIFDIIMATIFGLILPLGLTSLIVFARARSRRMELEARGRTDPALLAELDQLRTHMAEVDERLDFAERLLAQRTDRPELRAEGGS
ncbi:MAG TPA: hypothetical protein VFU45_07015 [Gemmatimonadales bacterium]|nr:hypothetical protein [Gemmatimonadales bacterium]